MNASDFYNSGLVVMDALPPPHPAPNNGGFAPNLTHPL